MYRKKDRMGQKEIKNLYSQAIEQGMSVRDFNDRFGRIDRNLIIFAKTARIVEPTKSTLNNPSPRKLFPLMRLDFL